MNRPHMDISVKNYLSQYTHFTKKVVYQFNLGNGGIGDYIKLFLVLLQFCIKNKIRMYYLMGDDPLFHYLKLRRDDMYITKDKLGNHEFFTSIENIKDDTYCIITPQDIFDIIIPSVLPSAHEHEEFIRFRLDIFSFTNELFYFTDEVKINAEPFMREREGYISIHLRLGDRFLEIDKNLIQRINDVRKYDREHLIKYISENKDKNILFFCDNHEYKSKMKEAYPHLTITDYEIGHTTYANTSKKQVLNTITDFYLLSMSASIYAASRSGFSMMASKFKNVPIVYGPHY